MAKAKVMEMDMEKMPVTLHLDEDDLPEIKDWKVGQKYTLILEVEQTGSHKGSMMDDKGDKMSADFKVISVKEGESPEEEKSEPKEEGKGEVAQALRRKFARG